MKNIQYHADESCFFLCSCVNIIYLLPLIYLLLSHCSPQQFIRLISRIYELMIEQLILRVDENVNNQSFGKLAQK
jgi:hypothetical protein